MTIHPENLNNDTLSFRFFSNLEDKFVTMRQVKIQNFRLVSLIVCDLWDIIFGGILSENGRGSHDLPWVVAK